jgi:hypothetical protein
MRYFINIPPAQYLPVFSGIIFFSAIKQMKLAFRLRRYLLEVL